MATRLQNDAPAVADGCGFDVRPSSGPPARFGVACDDVLDLNARTYRVNARLPLDLIIRLAFTAGMRAGRKKGRAA